MLICVGSWELGCDYNLSAQYYVMYTGRAKLNGANIHFAYDN